MTDTLILHHYDNSPYAEKIRLMFGLTGAHWQSLLSPAIPPRPNVDPLTGGYRRIPIAQLGADIFCDTTLIAKEIADKYNCPALDPDLLDADSAELMKRAEGEVFFSAIGAVSPLRLLLTMVSAFGPIGTYRFAKDRAGLLKGGTVRPPQGDKAKAIIQSLLETLETRLSKAQWINGKSASIADFAVYHPLWLHVSCDRRALKAGPRVTDWYQRVSDIGHGHREEINQADAFTIARDAEPRSLPTSMADSPLAIGAAAQVAPSDYGIVPVTGTLAALTKDRIILARDTKDFGRLHVHFPRSGYSLKAR